MVFVMMIGEQQNYHELPDFIDLAHELGVEQIVAKNLDVILKDGDDQRRFFSHDGEPAVEIEAALMDARQRARKHGIGLRFYNLHPEEVAVCEHNPLHSVFVNWEGFVSPCITLCYAEQRFFNGERVHVPCQRFGDIRMETLGEIWDKPAYHQFRRFFENRLRRENQAAIDLML